MTPSSTTEATDRRYSTAAMALHWLIAAAILTQIGLGWYFVALPRGELREGLEKIHISIGVTVLLLTLVRIAWRLVNRPPPLSDHIKPAERRAAHAVHGLLYLLLLALPLTGWVMESVGKRPIPFWTISWPHFPGLASMLAGHDARSFKDSVEWTHGTPLVWTMVALVVLHVAGALKHQFDGSPVLWRMIPGLRPAR